MKYLGLVLLIMVVLLVSYIVTSLPTIGDVIIDLVMCVAAYFAGIGKVHTYFLGENNAS